MQLQGVRWSTKTDKPLTMLGGLLRAKTYRQMARTIRLHVLSAHAESVVKITKFAAAHDVDDEFRPPATAFCPIASRARQRTDRAF